MVARFRHSAAVFFIAFIIGVLGAAPAGGGAKPRPGVSPFAGPLPSAFVAVRIVGSENGTQTLAISNTRSGRIERMLLPDPWQGMQVNSTAVDSKGQIWVSLSSGPMCSSDVEGCGPKPHTCAGEVLRIDPTTGVRRLVLEATDDELITDAQPSPNRRLIAYLDGPCDRSFFNQYVRIRDVLSGRSWTIGAGLPVCHDLHSVAWTPNGKSLVIAYGASEVPAGGAQLGYGACEQNAPDQLAVVPALRHAAGLPGVQTHLKHGCDAQAVTALRGEYAAIEACPPLTGPSFLDVFDSRLRVRSQFRIGSCLDGAELRSNGPGSALLGSSYQYCAMQSGSSPKSVTFVDTGSGPKTLLSDPGFTMAVSSISW